MKAESSAQFLYLSTIACLLKEDYDRVRQSGCDRQSETE